jgi:Zn2+/Cd2+-exporting ATPase
MSQSLNEHSQPQGNQHDDGHNHKDDHDHNHAHGGILGERTELYFAIICGVLLGVGFLLSVTTSLNEWVPRGFYIAAYFFGGYFTLKEALEGIRAGKFQIDSLMLVAAAGAAILGSWAEGALLLFLFSIGHALEQYAMGRAKRAIEALSELAPQTALVRSGDETIQVDVEALKIGDIIVVKPNERLPSDGFVIEGQSSINQAPVTGESVPVDKMPVASIVIAAADFTAVVKSSIVFAGTINGAGLLAVHVSRLAGDTTLARVVKMVSEAESSKSPTQLFTDKFQKIFVPAVLVLVGLLLCAGFVIDEPFRDTFYRAMAVLVAASPCALAIATPSAVLSGVARAARGGVLIKGGAPLEALGSLTAIAFDKTGTLTEGRPRLTDVVAADGVDVSELLSAAVSVERLSDHPLASAIVRDGGTQLGNAGVPTATDVRAIMGRGIEARVDGTLVHIGRDELFSEVEGTPLPPVIAASAQALREKGRTIMIVRAGGRYLGVLGMMDTPRETAKATIAALRDLGITRMIMISGDSQSVANAVAKEVGLDEAVGDLMPEDKVAAIKKLQAQQKVAMVGDGVNDAPAMAIASVGIAMGAAGSDVALETADVALMADDLSHLPFAVGLSRKTNATIKQNLFFSLGVVVLLVPATIFGLGIGPAVLAHEGSTVLVVLNALRLLAYVPKATRQFQNQS